MSVKTAFSRLSFKTLWPTISWTITAVSTQNSLCYFCFHTQSKKWLPSDGSSTNSKYPVWHFFIRHTKHQTVKTETKPKTAISKNQKTIPKSYFVNRTCHSVSKFLARRELVSSVMNNKLYLFHNVPVFTAAPNYTAWSEKRMYVNNYLPSVWFPRSNMTRILTVKLLTANLMPYALLRTKPQPTKTRPGQKVVSQNYYEASGQYCDSV